MQDPSSLIKFLLASNTRTDRIDYINLLTFFLRPIVNLFGHCAEPPLLSEVRFQTKRYRSSIGMHRVSPSRTVPERGGYEGGKLLWFQLSTVPLGGVGH